MLKKICANILFAIVCISASNVFAEEPLSEEELAKATNKVLLAVQSNSEIRVMVTLEYEDILEQEKSKRSSKMPDSEDGEMSAGIRRAIADRKQSVFPGGEFGDLVAEEQFSEAPIVVVTLRSEKSLRALLKHPQVRSIYHIETYKPQLQRHPGLSNPR